MYLSSLLTGIYLLPLGAIQPENVTESVTRNLTHCGANYCPPPAKEAVNVSYELTCQTPDNQVKTVLVIFLASVGIGLVLWALLPNLSRLTKEERGSMTCKTMCSALTGGFVFTFQDAKVREGEGRRE